MKLKKRNRDCTFPSTVQPFTSHLGKKEKKFFFCFFLYRWRYKWEGWSIFSPPFPSFYGGKKPWRNYFSLSLWESGVGNFSQSRGSFSFSFSSSSEISRSGQKSGGKKWKDSTVWEDGGGNQQYYTIYIFIWLKCNWRNSFHILPNNTCERGQDPYFEVTLQVGRGKCGRKKK